MKYFSLFSGIGGFELGIHRSLKTQTKRLWEENTLSLRETSDKSDNEGDKGLDDSSSKSCQHLIRSSDRQPTCVGFSEIDKYATQIYKKHFPNHKEYGNVTNIQWSNVPDFNLLVAGFPCQSFSIAGKREGFNDIRGTLFFEIARAAQEKHPRLLLLENVKGLLSHDKGRTFGTILNTLDELGYDLQWQVLNSKNFGVPQNRERVFIIGHLRTTPRPQVFPLRENSSGNIKGAIKTPVVRCLQGGGHSGMSILRTDESSPRPQGDKSNSSNSIRRATYSDDMRIRRLTPVECEKLQSFPVGWTESGVDIKGNCVTISDTQRYRCLGNAVTTNVISAIMEKLLTSPAG